MRKLLVLAALAATLAGCPAQHPAPTARDGHLVVNAVAHLLTVEDVAVRDQMAAEAAAPHTYSVHDKYAPLVAQMRATATQLAAAEAAIDHPSCAGRLVLRGLHDSVDDVLAAAHGFGVAVPPESGPALGALLQFAADAAPCGDASTPDASPDVE